MTDTKDGLSKLSALVSGKPLSIPAQKPVPAAELSEEQMVEYAQKVLEFASTFTGDDIYELQALIEFCADELRIQIREDNQEEGA